MVLYLAWPGISGPDNDKQGGPASVASKTAGSNDSSAPALFDKSKYSTNDTASLWVVVNKGRVLPGSYRPPDLVVPKVALRYSSGSTEMLVRKETASAMEAMFSDAAGAGVKLMLASGFRPYSMQSSIYNRHVRDYGRAQADRVSARPGHSEHQTGWAADLEPASRVCEIAKCFGDLAEGQWLAANAYRFGFIIRYPSGKEQLTGYDYEPWHVRYVGPELAGELLRTGQTLEQFFGLPDFATYPAEIYQLGSG